jgi:polar amino acid transport system substrate-binding protein
MRIGEIATRCLFGRLEMRVLRTLALASAISLAAFPARADLLEAVKQRGVLTVATEAKFAPFEFVKDGKIVGYSADLMQHILKELPKVEYRQLDLPWQGILPGLAAKQYDYVVTSVTATRERYEKYHLSLPIADATVGALKRKGNDAVTKDEDLAGKVVASQSESAQLQALEELAARLKEGGTPVSSIRTYVDFDEAYGDLAAGRVDVVVNSLSNLLEAVRQRPDTFEVVSLRSVPRTYFSWAGRKDEDSATLNEFFDRQIRRLNESGTLFELQKKWFGKVMKVPSDKLPLPVRPVE